MQIFISVKIWEGIVTDVRAFQKKPRVKKADAPDEYWDNGVKVFEVKLEGFNSLEGLSK
jgi:hypothetical protein|tara:strand:- start:724 stop:900 length:177 start_codon:yes stop_codon:yes gene_type:complete